MDCLIRATTWGLIQVVAQVDIQLLARANVPRACIRSRNSRSGPRQPITLPRKLSVRVLRFRKSNAQAVIVNVPSLADNAVQQLHGLTRRGYKLDQLSIHNLELPCFCVIPKKGGAGAVKRAGLHVFVEIGCGDGADPVVSALQCCAGTFARWRSS